MLLFIKNSTWNRNFAKSQQCEGGQGKKKDAYWRLSFLSGGAGGVLTQRIPINLNKKYKNRLA